MAADDRAEHSEKDRRVKELLDHLAEVLRGLSPDRLEAFKEYVDEQIKQGADDGRDAAEGD